MIAKPIKTEPDKKIVAFDFDGTLTYKDSFVSFLFDIYGVYRIGRALSRQPGMLTDYVATKDRGVLKSRLLYSVLGAISQADFEIAVGAFVARTGQRLFRPDALRTWQEQDLPDRKRVIVTASPELLVGPFGALIGADRVIGTRLGFSADGRLLPDLDGLNCRGPEKVRRLREAFGDSLDLEVAYGDTKGDSEMIAAARHGFYRVFKEKP